MSQPLDSIADCDSPRYKKLSKKSKAIKRLNMSDWHNITSVFFYDIPIIARRRAGIKQSPRYYSIPAFSRMTGGCLKVVLFNCQFDRVTRILGFILFLPLLGLLPIQTQLNLNRSECILNPTAQLQGGGTWVITNHPANMGKIQARTTCLENGVIRSGKSDFLSLNTNQVKQSLKSDYDVLKDILKERC